MGYGRRLAVACGLLAFTAGAVWSQPLFGPGQDPLAGSRVFGSKGCVKCHAINGVGGALAPDLGRAPRPRSFEDLTAAMWNHLPRMADRMQQLGIARPRLEPGEAADLIAFLATLSYFDAPGDQGRGQRLFVDKRCVVCHQVAGTGGVVGPDLDFLALYGSALEVAAAMWNHGPAMTEAMRARGIDRPTFAGSELSDLIAYLRSAAVPAEGPLHVLPGRADQGRLRFAEKRCAECHRGQGPGPDLAERGVPGGLLRFAATMWNKAPSMTAAMKTRGITVPPLRADELADIVAYLHAIRYFSSAGDARRGKAVAASKGCVACHAVDGRRGAPARDLATARRMDSPAAVVAAMWNHLLYATEGAPSGAPARPQISPAEMADLVAYLRAPGRAQ